MGVILEFRFLMYYWWYKLMFFFVLKKIIFFFFKYTYPDIAPKKNNSIYIPKLHGFKIYKKKGSKFEENRCEINEVTHYE